MTEARVAFLYKIAAMLPNVNMNKTHEKLKSYYRMRCKEITKGYGLPQKQFSKQAMCAHCCLEWRKGTETKVRSIKLSRRQRKRIKSQNKIGNHGNKANLLQSNEIEQTCAFCRHSIKTVVLKPNKSLVNKSQKPIAELKVIPKKIIENAKTTKEQPINMYSKTVQVFSLNNKKNTLKSTVNAPKIIKNNKKKKDKFAGLCQKAVLMSAHLKQEKVKQNKLSLFLKHSS